MRISFTLAHRFSLILLLTIAFQMNSYAQKDQHIHVVVFGVDGMSPDGVRKAVTPNMHAMMQDGAYTLHARSVLPTSSSPNWASMIMGAGPEQHGVTSNSWERDDDGIAPAAVGDEGIFPTIFSVVRSGKPAAEIGVVHDWDGFARLVETTKVNYISHQDGPYNTVIAAEQYINSKKPDFLFLHLDNVDGAGHGSGHGSPEYYKAVGLADSLLGVVMAAYKKAGIYDNTIFIVTADHGGIGFGHGGETMAEMEIPFLMRGPGIKKGYEIKRPVFQYDNAATVAYIWRLPTPNVWIGKPVMSAFTGNGDDTANVTERFMIEPPVIVSGYSEGAPAGGLYIDSTPTVVCMINTKYNTYYTLDGTVPTVGSMPYTNPFPLTKTTVVKMKSFDRSGRESATVCGFYRVVKKISLHPMKYSYYEIDEPEVLPDFRNLTPKATGTCDEFLVSQIPNRATNFAFVIDGYINIEKDGDYKFYTASDDGSKLYLDDKQLVNNDGSHGAKQHSGDATLTKGYHRIEVTYFNGGGAKILNVYYRGPGITKQIIPADVLFGDKK